MDNNLLNELKNDARAFFSDEVKLSFREVDELNNDVEITAVYHNYKASVVVSLRFLYRDSYDGSGYLKEKFRTIVNGLGRLMLTKNGR